MKKQAFVQALAVSLYCLLVGFSMFNVSKFMKEPSFLIPVTFLLLFSVSVLICGLAVFYKPYLLFFNNKKKEAIDLVLHTARWLVFFFICALLVSIFVH